jgi:hypothetical protein
VLLSRQTVVPEDFDHPSESQQNSQPIPLEYGNSTQKAHRPGIPISGIVSFASMVLFIPWVIGWFYFAWANPNAATLPPVIAGCFLGLPVFIALVFGGYSVIFIAAGWRNIFGMIAVAAAITVVCAWLYAVL